MRLQEAATLRRQGRLDEAESICRRAVAANPFSAEACFELGMVLHARKQTVQAIELVKRAVAFAPRAIQPRVNLAGMLGMAGNARESLEQLQMAVRLGAHTPELHNNLGATLDRLNRLPESVAQFRKAIQLRPGYPEAHCNLGGALRKTGRISAAHREYREALRLRPDYTNVYNGLADVSCELGDAREAVRYYRQSLAVDPNQPGVHSAMLYVLHYLEEYGPQELFDEHLQWERKFAPAAHRPDPGTNPRAVGSRRLRVGYVSPDLREHTVTKFITPALIWQNTDEFEVVCYSDTTAPDAVTARLKNRVERWRDTASLSDEKLEQLIREDQIDILVDLRGHGAGNRLALFARKPAPIQVNMVGYFNTTGLSTMDWRVTDAYQDPHGESDPFHTEKLFRMKGSCWCYTPSEDAPDVSSEPPAVANRFVTFGSLNKIVKVSRGCAEGWARALETVPKSRLLLTVAEGDTDGAVRRRLAGWGLDPARIDIVPKAATSMDYLERFGRIDIVLDTSPFNGITTTCDGLWMGVPAISLAGETSVSRAGRSILQAAGLGELAADGAERFGQIASELALDVGRLRELRRSLRERLRQSPLLGHRAFAAKLEHGYRRMAGLDPGTADMA